MGDLQAREEGPLYLVSRIEEPPGNVLEIFKQVIGVGLIEKSRTRSMLDVFGTAIAILTRRLLYHRSREDRLEGGEIVFGLAAVRCPHFTAIELRHFAKLCKRP